MIIVSSKKAFNARVLTKQVFFPLDEKLVDEPEIADASTERSFGSSRIPG